MSVSSRNFFVASFALAQVQALQTNSAFTKIAGRWKKKLHTKLNDIVFKTDAKVPEDKFSAELEGDRWDKKWLRVSEERRKQKSKGQEPTYDFLTAFSEGLRLPIRMFTKNQIAQIFEKGSQKATQIVFEENSFVRREQELQPQDTIFSLWQRDFSFIEQAVAKYLFGPHKEYMDQSMQQTLQHTIKDTLRKKTDLPEVIDNRYFVQSDHMKIDHDKTRFKENFFF